MREPGFYWVKYGNRWQIAECIAWWPIISDGTHGLRWLLVGKKRERTEREFDEIDERRIVREDGEENRTMKAYCIRRLKELGVEIVE